MWGIEKSNRLHAVHRQDLPHAIKGRHLASVLLPQLVGCSGYGQTALPDGQSGEAAADAEEVVPTPNQGEPREPAP